MEFNEELYIITYALLSLHMT